MNNQPNSPTQPLSDLYSLQTTQIKKITLPIFDETKLPSSWSSQQRKVLEETALKELEVQQRLTVAIRCAKICLEASLLTQEQTEQKLRELWHLYQMYYEMKSIANRFDRYLLDKTQTRNQSFSNLRSGQEIHDRINYIAAFAGLTIVHDNQHRLARLWSLLKDDRFAVAVTERARGLFNWQCADLVEIFINIAKLEWNEPLCPGTSIEQFGLDLLHRILAADVERLYDAAIDDVRANQYGVIPKNENPMDLIYMKYTHPLTTIAPDRSHTIELINNVQDKTNDLAYYINKLSDLAETIQRNTKWTKKVYLGGAKPQMLTGEVIFNIEHFIADVENDYHGDCMTPYRRYAANPRRCIHCQGTHASEDHHLSVSIPIVSNSGHTGLSLPQEQTQTNTEDNTSLKHKNTRFALPTQQSAFTASQQQ
jgi:hypothetical protein